MKLAKLQLVALISLAAVAAQAGPIPRNQISADANWYLHADIDQFKQTQLGKYVLEQLAKPEAKEKLDAFKTIFGFDMTTSLHGLTIYGPGNKPEEGVLLVTADFDADRLTTLAKGAKEYTGTPHGKYTIHSWIDDSKKQRSYGAIANGVVIFSQKADRVGAVLDVIDGSKPNLNSVPDAAKLGVTEKSAVLLGAARQANVPGDNPVANMLKNVNSLALSAMENGTQLQTELRLTTGNDESARQIVSINQGLIALLAMQSDKPEVVKLSQALSVAQSNNAVNIALKLPVADTIKMIQDAEAKKKK